MKITGSRFAFAQQLLVELQPALPRHAQIEEQAARHFCAVVAVKAAGRAECATSKLSTSSNAQRDSRSCSSSSTTNTVGLYGTVGDMQVGQ